MKPFLSRLIYHKRTWHEIWIWQRRKHKTTFGFVCRQQLQQTVVWLCLPLFDKISRPIWSLKIAISMTEKKKSPFKTTKWNISFSFFFLEHWCNGINWGMEEIVDWSLTATFLSRWKKYVRILNLKFLLRRAVHHYSSIEFFHDRRLPFLRQNGK